jgi:hypothetical protein
MSLPPRLRKCATPAQTFHGLSQVRVDVRRRIDMSNAATPQNPALPLPQNFWLHSLVMLILVILINLAQTVLGICALLQFLWMLFARERNIHIAKFGEQVGNWLAISARFVSGASDQKPFPWTAWS